MSYLNQPQDASMEDILSSIRKILDEEPSAPKTSIPQKKKEELIELTEIVEDHPKKEAITINHKPLKEKEVTSSSDDSLMSPAALSASISALSSLKTALGPTAAPLSIHGQTTLEDLAKSLLTPLLKEWLNQNLPTLVEKIVKEEVHRLTQRLS